jgi:hypothetical protein
MARRLWTTVNRDNLYVKVPATGGRAGRDRGLTLRTADAEPYRIQ